MSNRIFPNLSGLGWSVKKNPTFTTLKKDSANRKQVRALMQDQPIWLITLKHNYLRDSVIYLPYNLLTFSGQQENAAWTKENVTVATGGLAPPNDYLRKITKSNTTDPHRIYEIVLGMKVGDILTVSAIAQEGNVAGTSQLFMAVEWLDGAGTILRTDSATATLGSTPILYPYTTPAAPANSFKARINYRYLGATALNDFIYLGRTQVVKETSAAAYVETGATALGRYSEFDMLLGFFNSSAGEWDSFLFEDTLTPDSFVSGQLLGIGNASQAQFQLVRDIGGFLEDMQNINLTLPSPVIYKNNAVQTLVTHYTISSLGVVTFVTPPASGDVITADFGYYYRVTFDADEFEFENVMDQLWQTGEISLRSIIL